MSRKRQKPEDGPKEKIALVKSQRPEDLDLSIKVSNLPEDCEFRKIRIKDPETQTWTTERDYFYCEHSRCAQKPFVKKVS